MKPLTFILNFTDEFENRKIDGMLLLKIDEMFAKETLLITHSMKRRKLVRQIEKLQKRKRKEDKVRK